MFLSLLNYLSFARVISVVILLWLLLLLLLSKKCHRCIHSRINTFRCFRLLTSSLSLSLICLFIIFLPLTLPSEHPTYAVVSMLWCTECSLYSDHSARKHEFSKMKFMLQAILLNKRRNRKKKKQTVCICNLLQIVERL